MKNIVLVHGALGGSEDMNSIAASLALNTEDLRVHAFSFSGHAKTPFTSHFGIDAFAEELETFILNNQLRNTFVFGYSMGGFVALYLALKHKNLIQGIITLGTKFNWSKETVDKETRMLKPEHLREKAPGFAGMLEVKHGTDWTVLLHKTAAMMREIHEKDYLTPENLKTLETPVLLGLADKDQMVSVEETRHVFSTLPNAGMYMLPGSKHQIESVNPRLLSSVILHFISSVKHGH